MVSNILTTFPLDMRALECLQPRCLADIQYNFTVSEPSFFSRQLQSWHGPPASFFSLQQISIIGLAEANCRESGLQRDPVHRISWLSVLVRIWNSMALHVSILKAWHMLYSSLTWLTGLRENPEEVPIYEADPTFTSYNADFLDFRV